jgi:hypothetical protein
MLHQIRAAIARCRLATTSIFLTYVVSALVGGLMAHFGSEATLNRRDQLVEGALRNDAASLQDQAGNPVQAALLDFAGNVLLGAVPQTIMGVAVAPAYLSVAYQGWSGGIVSVDQDHNTRLSSVNSAVYFLSTLLLQFLAYSIAIGAGVRAGIDLYRENTGISWRVWQYRVPRYITNTVLWSYVAATPMFLLASSVEFLWPGTR